MADMLTRCRVPKCIKRLCTSTHVKDPAVLLEFDGLWKMHRYCRHNSVNLNKEVGRLNSKMGQDNINIDLGSKDERS